MQITLDSERIDRSNNDAFASYVGRRTKRKRTLVRDRRLKARLLKRGVCSVGYDRSSS